MQTNTLAAVKTTLTQLSWDLERATPSTPDALAGAYVVLYAGMVALEYQAGLRR